MEFKFKDNEYVTCKKNILISNNIFKEGEIW